MDDLFISPKGNTISSMELKKWVEAGYGRSSTLAKAIGVPPSFVSKMVNGTKTIPLEQCMPIERATGGAVTRADLRPSDYLIHWPELAITTEAA